MLIFILNHGLHYASCVFEGEESKGEIFKLEEHTKDFFILQKEWVLRFTESEINEASKSIVNIQKVKNGYVRPLI